MRRSPVSALADDPNLRLVDGGHGRPFDKAELSGFDTRPIVQPEHGIDGKPLEKPVLYHRSSTRTDFLGGLENQRQRAGKTRCFS